MPIARQVNRWLPGCLLPLLLWAMLPAPARAQSPDFNCVPNADGSGWICDDRGRAASLPVPGVTTAPEATSSPGQARGQQPAATDTATDSEAADTAVGAGGQAVTSTTTLVQSDTAARQLQSDLRRFAWDWLPLSELTPEQRDQARAHCCGSFIDPLSGRVDPGADPEQAATEFISHAGLSQPSPEVIAIEGDVIVRQGYRLMTNTDRTTIDREQSTLLLEGDVQFREPGLLLSGDSARVDSESRVNEIDNARYVLHDYGAHGDAARIVYSGDSGQITIENGQFSRCEPEQEFWSLRARRILLDPEASRGYARNVSLRLGDVPIFYYPFTLTFPLGEERVSGFLAPSLGSTRNGGTDIELPYYFNLAPHADATLSPRLVSDRGVMASAELRYLASWSMNTLNGAYLPDDDLYNTATANQPGSESPPTADRWFLGYEHNGALGSMFTTYVDYNAASDSDYFYDLGGSGLNVASQSHLNRQGRLNFNSPLLQAGLNVQRIQLIDPFAVNENIYKPYDRMPEFSFRTGGYLGMGLSADIRGRVTSFDRELDRNAISSERIEDGALVTGERVNLEPEISWRRETPGWFLRTTAKYKYLEYRLEEQALGTRATPDLGVPVYSADTGLVFERERRGGGAQTLEPRLYYLYSEYRQQDELPLFDTTELNFSFNQLFRDDRFAGGDRIADADQLALALTTRLLDENGGERARFSLGQIHYFEDRRVDLSNPLRQWQPRYSGESRQSALVGELDLRLGSDWRLNSDLQWNETRQAVDEGSFRLRYQAAADRLLNLSYRYRRLSDAPNFVPPSGIDRHIRQTDLSGVWPLNENWTLLGRWNYDHSNARNLESFLGVEWNNCCATIRLIGREWVDENELFVPNSEPNRGFFVQFTLHGLGDIAGGGLSNLLEDGIQGFRDYDEAQ